MRNVLPDNPGGAALLDVARHALLDEVAPALTGRQRYVLLMAANAVGVVMRELDRAEETTAAWEHALASLPDGDGRSAAALAAAIRTGAHDADAALHQALVDTVGIAAEIWKPAEA